MLSEIRPTGRGAVRQCEGEVEQVNISPEVLLQREVSHSQEQIRTQGANESAPPSPSAFSRQFGG